jgi:hypothetical protein
MYLRKYGANIGRLTITWLDLWSGSKGFEILYGSKLLFSVGFKD